VIRALGLAVLAAALVAVPGARADGDPASDILYFQDVYLPYSGVSKAAGNELTQTVSNARAGRYPIKVAVIATAIDLGSVPSLFGKPRQYAAFLGTEISSFYTGPLLIAMPAGFGFYKGGGNIAQEEGVLANVQLRGRPPDELVRSAASAVRRLAGIAEPPPARDKHAPRVQALPGTIRPGKKVQLRYRVSDDSGRSREVVRVYGRNYFLYANIVSPLERARGAVDSVSWTVPRILDENKLRFCVLARDRTGNASKASCAGLRVRRAT
jgi:hypothetical protein